MLEVAAVEVPHGLDTKVAAVADNLTPTVLKDLVAVMLEVLETQVIAYMLLMVMIIQAVEVAEALL